ncbi:MAG: hypothetical protein AAFV78_17890, partial [Bacteroidota bacterium]
FLPKEETNLLFTKFRVPPRRKRNFLSYTKLYLFQEFGFNFFGEGEGNYSFRGVNAEFTTYAGFSLTAQYGSYKSSLFEGPIYFIGLSHPFVRKR